MLLSILPLSASLPPHRRRLLLTAVFLVSATGSAQAGFASCLQFFPGQQPPRLPAPAAEWRPRELCFEAFAVLHSGRAKTPLYTVERLTREQLLDARDEQRSKRFFADARLPRADRATPDDYRGSGLDRGHMAPAGDMPTPTAMDQSFSLANVVPQAPVNNQRTWAGIERDTRHYVLRARGPVYVFTGAVHAAGAAPRPHRTIGDGGVWVPTHLYKLVFDAADRRAWAHWVENSDAARAGAPIAYEELVRRTGIEFLPGLRSQLR